MTAIAYKDGVIAADEGVNHGLVDLDPEKAWKYKGYLIGVTGKDCPPNDALQEWLIDSIAERKIGKKKETARAIEVTSIIDRFPTKANFDALVIRPNGKIITVSHLGVVYPINTPYWAVGSGGDICMGAMYIGGTAKQAVEAAIRFSPSCYGKVRSVKL